MKSILLIIFCILSIAEFLDAQSVSPAGAVQDMEARIMAARMKKKFDGDTALGNRLYTLYYFRNTEIDKVGKMMSGPALYMRMQDIINYADSLADTYIYMASCHAFIQKKIRLMEDVKPLSSREKNILSGEFMQLSRLENDKSMDERFDDLLHRVIKDTVYYASLYKKQIDRRREINYFKSLRNLVNKNKVTRDGVTVIAPLLLRKETSLAVLNVAYVDGDKEKDSLMDRAAAYYDSLIDRELVRDGAKGNSKFALAVQYRNVLHLNEKQVDDLLDRAAEMEQLKNTAKVSDRSEKKFTQKGYESEQLPLILTENQYGRLLVIANRDQALTWAKNDWQELRTRGLTEGYDSATVIKQIFNFDIEQQVARTRWVNDPVQLNAALKVSNETMPAALSKLKAARAQTAVGTAAASGTDK